MCPRVREIPTAFQPNIRYNSRTAPEMSDGVQQPRARILCVDDTEAQRYAVSRILRKAGFEVLETSTGEQALEMMSSRPDLVVLDVNLPDISGLDVCRIIKSREASARTPVLQVSATHVNTRARVEGLEGGADAYLVQPIDAAELIATIHALLRMKQAEEALWESQQQYRAFFEANPLSCLVFDVSDLKILAVNEAAIQEYGYSREQFTTMTLREIVAPDDLALFDKLLPPTSPQPRPGRVWKHRTRSGGVIDVEMICAALRLNERNAQLAIIQNVTDKLNRQAAEQQKIIQRLLLDRTLHVQEDERRRIARELHDEAGQLLTSLLVGLRSLSDARNLNLAKKQAKAMRGIASNAIAELSRLARGLHSSVLDDLGLEAAIRRYLDEFSVTHKIACKLDFESSALPAFNPLALDNDAQLNIYRIIQEALTNVARHSRASRVLINFKKDVSDLLITITDNGRGLSETERQSHKSRRLGIEGMRERAAILGGDLQIVSKPRHGLKVLVRVPVRTRYREVS
jgi:PAS domain S-box-containing protein